MTETIGRNGRGQVSSVVAQLGTTTLLELTDEYEATANKGNLKSETIQPLGRKQTFTYDGKNQLESAVEQPVGGGAVSWSQTFGYDDFGNRWVAGFTGSLPGGGPRPNGPSWYQIPVGQSTVINNRVKDETYDAAGNQLSLGGLTGAYDGENRLKSAGPGVSFSYDAFGRRVGMAANGKTTVFVYDALGRLTAEYVAGQTAGTVKQYVVEDQLGSTRLVTDAVGGVVRRSDYLPYGEEIPGAVGGRTLTGYGVDGGVRQGFTGQARDVETGLDYFGARYYSGALGRFSSLDVPLFDQNPGDPLSWNLFSYVRNNPLRYIDPTGRGCVSTQGAHSSTGIPLWTNTNDPRVPGPSCEEIDKADEKLKPTAVVNGGNDAVTAAVSEALVAFLFGGPKAIEYSPSDPFSKSFQRSIGMDAIMAGVRKDCLKDIGTLSVSTPEAFVNALIDGVIGGQGFYNPHAQLGAFRATYKRSGGSLSVTVTNPISLNSAAYHATSKLGIANPTSGPFGTVHQTIHIEATDPCRTN